MCKFWPNGLKCGVQAHISVKPIKNYVGSGDRIECIFQKVKLCTGFVGVRCFGTDVFEQKRNRLVRMWFSRNVIGGSVSWLPDVAVAALFSGGLELGQPFGPIIIALGFGQNPLPRSVSRKVAKSGFKLSASKPKLVISKSVELKWTSARVRSKMAGPLRAGQRS